MDKFVFWLGVVGLAAFWGVLAWGEESKKVFTLDVTVLASLYGLYATLHKNRY